MPKPIAVRLVAALKPVRPNSVISIEGINSATGSSANVPDAKRRKAARASLTNLEESKLVSDTFTACARCRANEEKPGGVICEPMPAVLEFWKRYRPLSE